MDENITHSYYNSCRPNTSLEGDNVSIMLVDEVFHKLLLRYEDRLNKNNDSLIKSVKDSFKDEIKLFSKRLNEMKNLFSLLKKEVEEMKKPKKEKKLKKKKYEKR